MECKFIKINPDNNNYDITIEIGEIIKHIKMLHDKEVKVKDKEINRLKNLVENLSLK